MKKNIDIDDTTLTKLKLISAFENMSVKALMEKAVRLFVKDREQKQMENLSREEQEDLGLLLLMQQVDKNDIVSEKEFMKALEE